MLNELDYELERRGHRFVHYTDDMVIFCGSKVNANRVLEHIPPFYRRKTIPESKLEENCGGLRRKYLFLGYGFYKSKKGFSLRVDRRAGDATRIMIRGRNLVYQQVFSYVTFPLRNSQPEKPLQQ